MEPARLKITPVRYMDEFGLRVWPRMFAADEVCVYFDLATDHDTFHFCCPPEWARSMAKGLLEYAKECEDKRKS